MTEARRIEIMLKIARIMFRKKKPDLHRMEQSGEIETEANRYGIPATRLLAFYTGLGLSNPSRAVMKELEATARIVLTAAPTMDALTAPFKRRIKEIARRTNMSEEDIGPFIAELLIDFLRKMYPA